jgi:hypothetical protein
MSPKPRVVPTHVGGALLTFGAFRHDRPTAGLRRLSDQGTRIAPKAGPLYPGKVPVVTSLATIRCSRARSRRRLSRATTLDVPSRETRMASIVCISPMGPKMLLMRLFD